MDTEYFPPDQSAIADDSSMMTRNVTYTQVECSWKNTVSYDPVVCTACVKASTDNGWFLTVIFLKDGTTGWTTNSMWLSSESSIKATAFRKYLIKNATGLIKK
jgi:hypothetical protein